MTFAGDTTHPVTVTQKDLADNQANGHVVDNAKWARVLQTAFLKYDHAEQYGTGIDAIGQDEGNSPFAEVRYDDNALHLLTGKSVSTDSFSLENLDSEATLGSSSNANVARTLETAFKNGELVTAATGGGMNNPAPLVADHIYSVLEYHADTDKVIVRNPWGHSNGPLAATGSTSDGITNLGDGKLEMSLQTFTQHFSDMNTTGQDPMSHDAQNTNYDANTALNASVQTVSDVLRGNTSALSKDLTNSGNADLQVLSDLAYGQTDFVGEVVKTTFGNVENSVVDAVRNVQNFWS